MDEVTRALNAMSGTDDGSSAVLLDWIYAELRRMAAGKMAGERAGHSLDATALVHEAYLRLAGGGGTWENRRHFFGAASEAMRRILVEDARRRGAGKRGGGAAATAFDEERHALAPAADDKLLEVHEVLDALEAEDALKAQIVKLRFFVGLGNGEIASLLGISERTVRRQWDLAKVWLYRAIRDGR